MFRRCILVAAVLAALAPASSAQVTLGQIDTFQDGTTDNWTVSLLGNPNPNPPQNVPTGGPAGAGDSFLLLTAVGGAGPSSHLSVANPAQWAGNYLTAGVTGISMDVNNFGPDDLFLRLAFENPTVGPPTDDAFSASPIFLPAGSGWTHVMFPIAPIDLLPLLGDVDTALSTTTVLRLYHSTYPDAPNPVFSIPPVMAQLGVDNIQAVPEPGTLAWLGIMGVLSAGIARKRLHRGGRSGARERAPA